MEYAALIAALAGGAALAWWLRGLIFERKTKRLLAELEEAIATAKNMGIQAAALEKELIIRKELQEREKVINETADGGSLADVLNSIWWR